MDKNHAMSGPTSADERGGWTGRAITSCFIAALTNASVALSIMLAGPFSLSPPLGALFVGACVFGSAMVVLTVRAALRARAQGGPDHG